MLIKQFNSGTAEVFVFSDRKEMGKKASSDAVSVIKKLLEEKEKINIMFAAAPSQNEMLEGLVAAEGIDWSRVNAFHMDEYIGIPSDNPAGFALFLKNAIFGKLNFKSVNYINSLAEDPLKEAERYAELLKANKLDVCILGVGETGHIAFNDPDVADFNDPVLVKPVKMDEQSRIQQVHDGCFEKLEDVPNTALTVTVPGMVCADYLFCSVPASNKAEAVKRMFTEEISEKCPATILRRTENSKIYLDADSAKLLLDL